MTSEMCFVKLKYESGLFRIGQGKLCQENIGNELIHTRKKTIGNSQSKLEKLAWEHMKD